MSDYDIFILILCLIVFVLLVTLSAICLSWITKMYKRLICCGEEDEKLIKELKKQNKCCSKAGDVVAFIFNIVICVLFVGLLCFSLFINSQDAAVSDSIPTLRVVKSDSMSEKYSGNTYLTTNGLDDQFDTFDIILTYKMPDEFELEVYDIVVYEYRDELVIHRIIAIEEPNENHPDSRLFTLRGDANQYSDSLKVEYSQMKGIYRGERVRFVGSFVLFMQSPAGWLCVLLIVAVVFIAPALENYIGKQKEKRLQQLGLLPGGAPAQPKKAVAVAVPVQAPQPPPARTSTPPARVQTPTYAATNIAPYYGAPYGAAGVPPIAPYAPPVPIPPVNGVYGTYGKTDGGAFTMKIEGGKVTYTGNNLANGGKEGTLKGTAQDGAAAKKDKKGGKKK